MIDKEDTQYEEIKNIKRNEIRNNCGNYKIKHMGKNGKIKVSEIYVTINIKTKQRKNYQSK